MHAWIYQKWLTKQFDKVILHMEIFLHDGTILSSDKFIDPFLFFMDQNLARQTESKTLFYVFVCRKFLL